MTDYDAPSVYIESVRTAKKEHKCKECCRKISIGEKYHYTFGVWSGEASTHKTCSHCKQGLDLLVRECHGFVHGLVCEDLHEHISEILPWSLTAAKLVIGMRRKWKRFDGNGLMKMVEI